MPAESRSSGGSSFPARSPRSSPARASRRRMRQLERSSANGPARRPASASSCCSRSHRSTPRASSPPSSFSRRSPSVSTGSSRSPSACSFPGTGRSSMLRNVIAVAVAVAALLVPAAAAGPQHVTLTLDWTPNPDHVGLYYARDEGLFAKAGLDVSIHAPSDPTAPLKLVAAGKTDFGVSYEQEVFLPLPRSCP